MPAPAPLPEEEALAPGELTPAPEPFGAPAPVPEEPLPTPGEEPEELAPGAAEAEPVEGETFTVTVEVTFDTGTTAGIFEEPTTGLPEAGPIIIEREPGAPSLAEEGITPEEPATSEEEEESAASEEEEASLTLSEDSVAAGNDVNVRGTNFERNDEVTITLDGEPTDTFPEPVIAGSDGDVVSVLTIPDDISEGEHEIEASDESGSSGTVSITITATEELTEEEERPEGEVETPAMPEEEQGPTISETEPTEEVGEEEEESEPTP